MSQKGVLEHVNTSEETSQIFMIFLNNWERRYYSKSIQVGAFYTFTGHVFISLQYFNMKCYYYEPKIYF